MSGTAENVLKAVSSAKPSCSGSSMVTAIIPSELSSIASNVLFSSSRISIAFFNPLSLRMASSRGTARTSLSTLEFVGRLTLTGKRFSGDESLRRLLSWILLFRGDRADVGAAVWLFSIFNGEVASFVR